MIQGLLKLETMDRLIIHDNYDIQQSMKMEDYIYGKIIQ